MELDKSKFLKNGFTVDQIAEIDAGLKQGVNAFLYADKRYLAIQMRQIRFGLEEKLDVSVYADPRYDWFQMEEIRKGMLTGLPIGCYASPDISYDRMKQIRLGLCDEIDLSRFKHLDAGVLKQLRLAMKSKVNIVPFINEGYDKEQLEAIREALEKRIPISPYLDKCYRGVAIREICIGIEHGVDVSVYLNPKYYWQQMREIRLGLEHRVDVSKYVNRYYTFEQMREIRLGLEAGLDVSYFSSLMYTAEDMKKRRLALLEHPALAVCEETDDNAGLGEEDIIITLDEENTKAYAQIQRIPEENFRIEMLRALRNAGINTGVKYDTIDHILETRQTGVRTLIATSIMPEDGKDGYYECFFRKQISRTPKQEEDGTVDYRSVECFERVSKGQKLAVYHGAVPGKAGMTVTGIEIPARKGKEQCILTGKGFHRLDDNVTYVSDLDGVISYNEIRNKWDEIIEIRMEITQLLVVDCVTLATGDINFNGSVYVEGNVGNGVNIHASGDVLVGGYVQSSTITAGGNVSIRYGMNVAGKGEIHAVGDVTGMFFESVKIVAGGDIYSDYFMNCELYSKNIISAVGKKGSLAGGVATADYGLKVNQLGNQAGIITRIKLGIGDKIKQELNQLEIQMSTVKSELDGLTKIHEELMKKFSPDARSTNDLYIKLGNGIYAKEQELSEMTKQKQMLELKQKKAMGVSAVVEGTLYDNVIFDIDQARLRTGSTIAGVKVVKQMKKIVMEPLEN